LELLYRSVRVDDQFVTLSSERNRSTFFGDTVDIKGNKVEADLCQAVSSALQLDRCRGLYLLIGREKGDIEGVVDNVEIRRSILKERR
jgi:hypothetical protein